MQSISDIYKKYHIPAIVVRHQLRVAAVAYMLSGRIEGVSEREVIRVGLFHDMGNILKMDLSPTAHLRDLLAPDTALELERVRKEFSARFGFDEHAASIEIGRLEDLSEKELSMIDNMRYSRTEWVLKEAPMDMKVIKYADLRVAPYGIVSMQERIDEARRRYHGRTYNINNPQDREKLQTTEALCFKLESLVCAHADIDPASITEAAAKHYIEEMLAYSI